MSRDRETIRAIPPGILLFRTVRGRDWSFKTYRFIVLVLTFLAYTSYHASRKPNSIVKSVLVPQPKHSNHSHLSSVVYPWPLGDVFVKKGGFLDKNHTRGGWPPFDTKDGTSKLGEIDVAFLACYSIGVYISGHLGDTLDLRLFLTSGMIGGGIFVGLIGMGYFWNIHVFWYFLVIPMIAGFFQSTGWPSVVAVIGNWFGKRKRGLIMGIWNAHTSVGNIIGSLLAAGVLEYGWGWSFIVPGAFIIVVGLLVFLFLPAYPEDIELPCPSASPELEEATTSDLEAQAKKKRIMGEEKQAGSSKHHGSGYRKSVGIVEAFMIPGVIPFALCLFFAKLVAYTFLYWLPFYLSQTEIGGEYVSVKSAGNLSTLFDVGGMIGGVLAGYASDKLRARAMTATTFLYLAIPSMLLYRKYGGISQTANIVLMMISGLFINAPYALITTAVSVDLGTHSSIRGDSRALATVTAIIDGTGSLGSALGPLLTGFLSTRGWSQVFMMLSFGAFIAGLLLSSLVLVEIREISGRRGRQCSQEQNSEAPASQPLLRSQR